MKTARKKAVMLSLVIAASVIVPVHAYVLPLNPLLDQLQEKRDQSSVRSHLVEGHVVLNGPAGRRILAAERSVLFDGRCRLEIVDTTVPELERAHVIWDGARVLGSGHQELLALAALESMACPLSAGGGSARGVLEELMERLEIDRAYTGYSRLDGRVAYVIGGRPWETDKPQIWLDKETLLPVRVMATVDGARLDVRMLGYGDIVSGDLHPRVIQAYVDGGLKASFKAERIERNVELSAALFR